MMYGGEHLSSGKPMSAFFVEADMTSLGGKVFGCASISIINGKRIA